MLQPLDGPSSQEIKAVTSGTVFEAKIGASPLPERKVLTIQADQKYYVYFGDGSGAPSVATVQAHGFEIEKSIMLSLEASASQEVYLLAVSATANIRIAERA